MKLKIGNPLNKKHLRADKRAYSGHNAKRHWLGTGMYSSRQREGRHRYNEPHHIAEANVVHEDNPMGEGIPNEILEYLVALRDRAIGVLEHNSMETEPSCACKESRPRGRGSYFDYISPFDKKRPKDYILKRKKQLTRRGYTINYRGVQRASALKKATQEAEVKGYNAALNDIEEDERQRRQRYANRRQTRRAALEELEERSPQLRSMRKTKNVALVSPSPFSNKTSKAGAFSNPRVLDY